MDNKKWRPRDFTVNFCSSLFEKISMARKLLSINFNKPNWETICSRNNRFEHFGKICLNNWAPILINTCGHSSAKEQIRLKSNDYECRIVPIAIIHLYLQSTEPIDAHAPHKMIDHFRNPVYHSTLCMLRTHFRDKNTIFVWIIFLKIACSLLICCNDMDFGKFIEQCYGREEERRWDCGRSRANRLNQME